MTGHCLRWSPLAALIRIAGIALFLLFALFFGLVALGGEPGFFPAWIAAAYLLTALLILSGEFYHSGAIILTDEGIRYLCRGNFLLPWDRIAILHAYERRLSYGVKEKIVEVLVLEPKEIHGSLWARISGPLVGLGAFDLRPKYYGYSAEDLAALLNDPAEWKRLPEVPVPKLLRLDPSRTRLMHFAALANIVFLCLTLLEAVVEGIKPERRIDEIITMAIPAFNALAVLNVKPSLSRLLMRGVAALASAMMIISGFIPLVGSFVGRLDIPLLSQFNLVVGIGAMLVTLAVVVLCRPGWTASDS